MVQKLHCLICEGWYFINTKTEAGCIHSFSIPLHHSTHTSWVFTYKSHHAQHSLFFVSCLCHQQTSWLDPIQYVILRSRQTKFSATFKQITMMPLLSPIYSSDIQLPPAIPPFTYTSYKLWANNVHLLFKLAQLAAFLQQNNSKWRL